MRTTASSPPHSPPPSLRPPSPSPPPPSRRTHSARPATRTPPSWRSTAPGTRSRRRPMSTSRRPTSAPRPHRRRPMSTSRRPTSAPRPHRLPTRRPGPQTRSPSRGPPRSSPRRPRASTGDRPASVPPPSSAHAQSRSPPSSGCTAARYGPDPSPPASTGSRSRRAPRAGTRPRPHAPHARCNHPHRCTPPDQSRRQRLAPLLPTCACCPPPRRPSDAVDRPRDPTAARNVACRGLDDRAQIETGSEADLTALGRSSSETCRRHARDGHRPHRPRPGGRRATRVGNGGLRCGHDHG